MPEINANENEPQVLVGSCDAVVVLRASELPSYFDGYRVVTIIAIAIAIPMLRLVEL